MIGKTVSHYRIIEKLGEGGMGVVYKAEDTKLKRNVALKFLPPELTHNQESKKRFIREAHAASALEHDNICTIHEINETGDGQLFIVMACYEGQTLKKIIGDQQLSVSKAIDIATQIGKGLQKAHEKGIVHRDIKPANIFITNDGSVKILDFGLAKLAGQAQLTKDSSTLGTVAYMSPEQLSGKDVDHRTDIWSLGVVLYEMLTGELPFKGDYEQAITYAILNEDPKQLENFSINLQEIIKRLLVKNPTERYAGVTELLDNITGIQDNNEINKRRQSSQKRTHKKTIIISVVVVLILIAAITSIFLYPTSNPQKSIQSLAVIPFVNIKRDAESEYLGDALAAEIIRDLMYFKNITVLPFSAVQNLEDWEELNVDYLLTGNFIKETNIIRLNIEFLFKGTNQIIWQESVEKEFVNTFELLDNVSQKVITGLSIQFSSEEQQRMQKDVPKNPVAYEYYLRSRSYPLTKDGHPLAIEMLKKSIELDSTYAPAYVELGFRTIRYAQNILGGQKQVKLAEEYFLKAKAINPDLLDGFVELASVYIETGRFGDAMSLLQNVLRINPNNANAHFHLGYLYRYAGLLDKSAYEAEKALHFYPTNKRFRSIGHTYLYLGKYKKALEAYNLDSTSAWANANKGAVYLREDKNELALKSFNRAIELEQNTFPEFLASGLIAYLEGQKDKGLNITTTWEQKNVFDAEMIYRIACNYSLFGDKKGCVRALFKSINAGFFNYPFLINDPFLDPVRDDPEFHEVLALAKEKHEAFKQKYFAEEK